MEAKANFNRVINPETLQDFLLAATQSAGD